MASGTSAYTSLRDIRPDSRTSRELAERRCCSSTTKITLLVLSILAVCLAVFLTKAPVTHSIKQIVLYSTFGATILGLFCVVAIKKRKNPQTTSQQENLETTMQVIGYEKFEGSFRKKIRASEYDTAKAQLHFLKENQAEITLTSNKEGDHYIVVTLNLDTPFVDTPWSEIPLMNDNEKENFLNSKDQKWEKLVLDNVNTYQKRLNVCLSEIHLKEIPENVSGQEEEAIDKENEEHIKKLLTAEIVKNIPPDFHIYGIRLPQKGKQDDTFLNNVHWDENHQYYTWATNQAIIVLIRKTVDHELVPVSPKPDVKTRT